MIVDPLKDAILPGLDLLPSSMNNDKALIMLLAIGLQESGFLVRSQRKGGPARGFWQFEQGGGVRGVLRHPASSYLAHKACQYSLVVPTPEAVWPALAENDRLACAFARLLLWTDARPLPEAGQIDYAWDYYIDNWRPGKPHRDRWTPNYEQALQLLKEYRE